MNARFGSREAKDSSGPMVKTGSARRETEPAAATDIVQVAGIVDESEARMLLDAGVDWLGIPLRLAVHHEDVDDAEAADIVRRVGMQPFTLITYLDRAADIAKLCQRLNVSRVQLHGSIHPRELRELRDCAPDLVVLKSIVVRAGDTEAPCALVERFTPYVDAFITDTYDPVTGASGATGLTHDWRVSRAIVASTTRPVILAGGLRPDNVADAIRAVRPAGVDVHTGIEQSNGRKDPLLTQAFVAHARAAFNTYRTGPAEKPRRI
ncbi:phosphoribosylanthranilate isomerase [Streptomyces sp. NPDC050658]|uniref:phosphoribosylanthranilate isomerase n=1 Tax=unclassified Streptomyces TaxID=2593676 RepID=UPI00343162E2